MLPSATAQAHDRSECGSVMLEFAIAIPFLLFITFGTLQLAFLYVADSVMEYAAFSTARAELVREVNVHRPEDDVSPQEAAQLICSFISFGDDPPADRTHIPGWGPLKGSAYAKNNTHYEVQDLSDGAFITTVHFRYTHLFPIMSLPFLQLSAISFSETSDADGTFLLSKSYTMRRGL